MANYNNSPEEPSCFCRWLSFFR